VIHFLCRSIASKWPVTLMGVSWGGSNNSFPAGAILHEPDLCAIAGVQKLISAAPATSEAPTPTPDFLIEILNQSCASISNMMFPVWFGCKSAVLQVNDCMLPNWTTSAFHHFHPSPTPIYLSERCTYAVGPFCGLAHLMGCLDNLRNCLGVPIKIHDAGSKDLNLSICALPKSACGLGPMKFPAPISGLFQLSQVPNTLSYCSRILCIKKKQRDTCVGVEQ
jgi:hypothetical protein